MGKLRIRNWREFQQYKDRCPPWIKLHREILQSEDWVMWSNESRVLAICIMLLASRTEDGTVPANAEYIKRAGYLHEDPDLEPLIACGFLELVGDASNLYRTLASCTTETEAEAEAEAEAEERSGRFVKPSISDIEDYCREKGYTHVDPERFFYYYESKDWMVGKHKMKNWRGGVAGWEAREKKATMSPQQRRLEEMKRERGV